MHVNLKHYSTLNTKSLNKLKKINLYANVLGAHALKIALCDNSQLIPLNYSDRHENKLSDFLCNKTN